MQNVPEALDNQMEFDPSVLTADPQQTLSPSRVPVARVQRCTHDLRNTSDVDPDPFALYFSDWNPTTPPKVLITTSPNATKVTYNFYEELVDIFPGAEFIRREKERVFERGRIAGWAADRAYQKMLVVNEGVKKPSELSVLCGVSKLPPGSRCNLPNGPTAYFRSISMEFSRRTFVTIQTVDPLQTITNTIELQGHNQSTAHFPELGSNNFVTRLGHTVGRMFQTMFPPVSRFQGRQVDMLRNRCDFLSFRCHGLVSSPSSYSKGDRITQGCSGTPYDQQGRWHYRRLGLASP